MGAVVDVLSAEVPDAQSHRTPQGPFLGHRPSLDLYAGGGSDLSVLYVSERVPQEPSYQIAFPGPSVAEDEDLDLRVRPRVGAQRFEIAPNRFEAVAAGSIAAHTGVQIPKVVVVEAKILQRGKKAAQRAERCRSDVRQIELGEAGERRDGREVRQPFATIKVHGGEVGESGEVGEGRQAYASREVQVDEVGESGEVGEGRQAIASREVQGSEVGEPGERVQILDKTGTAIIEIRYEPFPVEVYCHPPQGQHPEMALQLRDFHGQSGKRQVAEVEPPTLPDLGVVDPPDRLPRRIGRLRARCRCPWIAAVRGRWLLGCFSHVRLPMPVLRQASKNLVGHLGSACPVQ